MFDNIVDREEILTKLLEGLTKLGAKMHYALIGPRRIGKTAILKELEKRLADQNVIVTRLDFSKYGYDPSEFNQAIIDSLTESYKKTLDVKSQIISQVGDAIKEIKKLRRLRVEFDLTLDDVGKPVWTIRPAFANEKPRFTESFGKAFSYASHLATVSGTRVVIILDEAQKIIEWTRFDGMKNVMDQFRSIIDELAGVSIILSGSRVHMLKSIFGEGGSPLFGRFNLIEVGPLEEKDARELYLNAALEVDRNEAEEVYRLVGGHPFYLLVMAEARRPGEAVAERYERLLTNVTGGLYLYVNYILSDDLGSKVTETNYARILRALSKEEMSVSKIAKETGLRPEWLIRYLTKLIEFDLIFKMEGNYKLKDQIVRDFFRLNYPEETIPS